MEPARKIDDIAEAAARARRGVSDDASLQDVVSEVVASAAHGSDAAGDALRIVARREHTLLSLAELSQELSISHDLFHVADLVLFNLMGHIGTSRAALWLVSEGEGSAPVLVRSHGINRQVARALATSCSGVLIEHLSTPLQVAELESLVGTSAARLIQNASIEVFAPLLARGEALGLIALGPRIGGDPYGPAELQALQTSLGMVGVTIQNMIFYNRMIENNRKLRIANQNLRSLDRLKSEFLSNVNHELRTPLTKIIAYAECAHDLGTMDEKQRDFLKVVLEEGLKLQALLENVLALSAVTREDLPIQLAIGDVAPVLARYYQERLPGVSEGLRELLFECEHDLPDARFDEERLLQIVDALVDNAVKFTPKGTRIVLRVRQATDNEQSWVAIDVHDDGPGIPRERLGQVFESFFQIDGSSTRKVGGMGIGLAYARQLAERTEGRVTVESEIGKGSRFTLWLRSR